MSRTLQIEILALTAAFLLPFTGQSGESRILFSLKPTAQQVSPFCYTDDSRTSDAIATVTPVESVLKKFASTLKITEVKDGRIEFTFLDQSPTWWSLKGIRIKLDHPVDWKEFEGVALNYRVSGAANSLWLAFLDEKGRWWDCIDTGVTANTELRADFEKQAVRRSNLTAKFDKKAYPKDTGIVEIAIYFRVYTGICKRYKVEISNIRFIAQYGDARLKYHIDPNFPQQWKSRNLREDGVILVNGKPFFPLLLFSCIGMDPASATHRLSRYNGPTDDASLLKSFQKVADAGFNSLFSYTTIFYDWKAKPGWNDSEGKPPEGINPIDARIAGAKRFLDFCGKAGLMGMIYNPYPDPLKYRPEQRRSVLDKHRERVERTVNALKNHPDLLLWYMWDEPCEIMMSPNDLIESYQMAKKLDPAHPFLIIGSEPRNDVMFFRAADIIAPDGYPMASDQPCTKDVDNARDWLRPACRNGHPSIWTVILLAYWDTPRWNRFPSAEHIRALSFLSLADNQKGLIFYSDRNYSERAPEFWKNVSRAIRSIRNITPYILASQEVVTDKVKSSSPHIRYILHRTADKQYFLLTVNPLEEMAKPLSIGKVSFTFQGLNLKQVEALGEDPSGMISEGKNRQVEVAANKKGFSDNFWEYGTHAYLIEVE